MPPVGTYGNAWPSYSSGLVPRMYLLANYSNNSHSSSGINTSSSSIYSSSTINSSSGINTSSSTNGSSTIDSGSCSFAMRAWGQTGPIMGGFQACRWVLLDLLRCFSSDFSIEAECTEEFV